MLHGISVQLTSGYIPGLNISRIYTRPASTDKTISIPKESQLKAITRKINCHTIMSKIHFMTISLMGIKINNHYPANVEYHKDKG